MVSIEEPYPHHTPKPPSIFVITFVGIPKGLPLLPMSCSKVLQKLKVDFSRLLIFKQTVSPFKNNYKYLDQILHSIHTSLKWHQFCPLKTKSSQTEPK